MSFRETEVVEVSVPLPLALDTRIFIRLTMQAKAILLFLTTASTDRTESSAMGSFVYALPDRFNPRQPLATTLFSTESSVEFTTRMARLVARKAQLPVYVTNSASLESAGLGGSVEEEVEAFGRVAEVVLGMLQRAGIASSGVGM